MDRPRLVVAALLSLSVFFSVIAGAYIAGVYLAPSPRSTSLVGSSSSEASTTLSTVGSISQSSVVTNPASSSVTTASTVTQTQSGTATGVSTITSEATLGTTASSSAAQAASGTATEVTSTVNGVTTTVANVAGSVVTSVVTTTTSMVSGAVSTAMTPAVAGSGVAGAALEREIQSSALILAPICWILLGGALVWRGRIRSAYSDMGFGSDVFELFMKMKGGATRVKVLNTLTTPKDRLQLAEELGVDWKTIDRHVQILNKYGFVREQAVYGTVRMYEVTQLGKMLLNVFDEIGDGHVPTDQAPRGVGSADWKQG